MRQNSVLVARLALTDSVAEIWRRFELRSAPEDFPATRKSWMPWPISMNHTLSVCELNGVKHCSISRDNKFLPESPARTHRLPIIAPKLLTTTIRF